MPETKLTSRGRYAVMVMVELACQETNKPVPLSDISRRSRISVSYLEQLVAALRHKELVKSHRGPGGGYMLARAPETIFVSGILDAAEESIPAKRPTVKNRTVNDATEKLWSDISEMLYVCLSRITLDDVVEEKTLNNPFVAKLFEIDA